MKFAIVGAVLSTEIAIKGFAAKGLKPEYVVTLPHALASRHSDYRDIGKLCREYEVPCFEKADVNDQDFIAQLSAYDVDVILVIGWSRLVQKAFQSLAKQGAIGYHPALLPKMRGRAALAWTILLGCKETGGTLFWIDDGVDSGDIICQERIILSGTEYLGDLLDTQMQALENMIAKLSDMFLENKIIRIAQNHKEATYLALRRPEDGLIDWTLPAEEIHKLIRAVSRPYPGAFSYLKGKKFTIWRSHIIQKPEWHALPGQIFTLEEGKPVIRCGDDFDLCIEDFSIEGQGTSARANFAGQPRLSGLHNRG